MEFEQILQLIDHVSDSKLTSFQYEGENLKLSLECGTELTAAGNNGCGAAMSEAVSRNFPPLSVENQENITQEKPEETTGNLVKSPLVGTFYAAPAEDAPAFVKVGDKVSKGQVLAIVEAMKLMNEIECDFDGEIAEIYVENGQTVEYGMPLFRVV